jgi:signal transduction histidine kinase
MATSRRAAVQATVWTLYVLVSLGMVRSYLPLTSGIVAVMLLVGAGLWAGTEALRALVLRRGWLDGSPGALVARLVLLPPLAAFAIQLSVFAAARALVVLGVVAMPAGSAREGLGTFLGYVANTAILLWLWLAAWGSVQFLRRWKQGEVERWQSEAARRSLELEVLRAQVNPHFIFNALNNLRALINEDPEKARDAVTRLSNTLRHTLYHSAREHVSLADELSIVRDYVALEQLHYEQRLRVRWDVAAGVERALVPPMVLQLLVENAIKHGIARTPGGGEVGLVVARDGDLLSLAVSNPGSWAPGPQAGIGLAHLKERLARAGGPGADCRIEAADGRVTVCVRLGLLTDAASGSPNAPGPAAAAVALPSSREAA